MMVGEAYDKLLWAAGIFFAAFVGGFLPSVVVGVGGLVGSMDAMLPVLSALAAGVCFAAGTFMVGGAANSFDEQWHDPQKSFLYAQTAMILSFVFMFCLETGGDAFREKYFASIHSRSAPVLEAELRDRRRSAEVISLGEPLLPITGDSEGAAVSNRQPAGGDTSILITSHRLGHRPRAGRTGEEKAIAAVGRYIQRSGTRNKSADSSTGGPSWLEREKPLCSVISYQGRETTTLAGASSQSLHDSRGCGGDEAFIQQLNDDGESDDCRACDSDAEALCADEVLSNCTHKTGLHPPHLSSGARQALILGLGQADECNASCVATHSHTCDTQLPSRSASVVPERALRDLPVFHDHQPEEGDTGLRQIVTASDAYGSRQAPETTLGLQTNLLPDGPTATRSIVESYTEAQDGGGLLFPCEDAAGSQNSRLEKVLVAMLLFFLFSVHSFLEGVGLGSSKNAIATIGAGIIMHKGLAAFAVGTTFLECELSTASYLISITIFSMMTPAGTLFGAVIETPSNEGFFTAIAAGAFLFIALCELLPKAFKRKKGRLGKVIALATGSCAVCWTQLSGGDPC